MFFGFGEGFLAFRAKALSRLGATRAGSDIAKQFHAQASATKEPARTLVR